MKRIVLMITALAAISPFAGAETTQRLSASKANDYALVYTLPNTVLDITFEVEKQVKAPGEFSQYAKKYLDANDVILKPSETVTIKSVTINTRGVANASERYAVKFASGSAPYMILNDQGMPLSVNTTKDYQPVRRELPKAQPAAPTALETAAARQAVSQEMLMSKSTAKRAELASQLIFGIRESRNEIISGQSEKTFPDGRALKLALDNLTAQEDALTAMFVGTTKTSTDVYTMTYMPQAEDSVDVTDEVIARLSASKGIVASSDLAGQPIYLTITPIDNVEVPVDDKGNPLPLPKGGFVYAIPGKAQVVISYDGRTLADTQVDIAQYGILYALKPDLFTNKKSPMMAIFDPTTGALREVGPTTPPAAAPAAPAAEE